MPLVRGVLDGGEEFSIAPGATAIFGRAAAGNFDEARIERPRLGIGEPLNFDRVLPTVTEFIKIHQLLRADVSEDVAEPRLSGVEKVAAQSVSGELQPTPRTARRGDCWSIPWLPGWLGAAGRAECRTGSRRGGGRRA
jgi:hypothetical protein